MNINRSWLRIWFIYPALSPLIWGVSFILGGLILLWSSLHLIMESVPHGLIFVLMGVAFGLSRQIDKHIYPALAPLYEGGWMPSLQKTWLSLSFFALMGVAAYVFWWNWVLGLLFFVGIFAYSWRYLPRADRKQNPLQAFSELVNSSQRIAAPGIRQVEQVCLWACLFWLLLSTFALIDVSLVVARPIYSVRLLGTEMHSGGRGGPSYSANLAGWRRPQRKINPSINRRQYEQLVPGKSYQLQTTRSLFGSERLLSFKLAPLAK